MSLPFHSKKCGQCGSLGNRNEEKCPRCLAPMKGRTNSLTWAKEVVVETNYLQNEEGG